MGFDKFAWIKAVAADRHIPEGQRFVLVYYALVYVRHGEEVVCVRQETIAQRCATSLSTVRRAMAGARARGYLVLAEPRQRGRGHQRADAYRLVIPATEIGANLTPIPGIGVKNNQNRGQKPPEYRSKVTEIGVNANSLTSENDTPKGLYKGLDKGGGKGTADAAPPPPQNLEDQKTDSEGAPSPYCRRHQPDGTEAPCFACGQARQRHQAAQAEAERHAAEAARVAEISRCNQCDQHGWWGEPGLASYEDLDGSAQTRAETLTPMAFVPPERTDELPAYLHNWLTECTTDGLTWWALKCQHGTSDPDDPRYIGGTQFYQLIESGYRAVDLDAFLAADGDVDAAHKLRDDAFADWRSRRDERSRAERAARAERAERAEVTNHTGPPQKIARCASPTPETAPQAAPPSPPPRAADDPFESLRDYGPPDENEYLFTPPDPTTSDDYAGDLACWHETRRDVFADRAAIRACNRCDNHGWPLGGGFDEPCSHEPTCGRCGREILTGATICGHCAAEVAAAQYPASQDDQP